MPPRKKNVPRRTIAKKKKAAKTKPPAKKRTAAKKARKPATKSASKDTKSGLNSQQLKFCRNIANGDNNINAYLAAYKGVNNRDAARASATKLLTNANVIEKIAELREAVEVKTTLSRLHKRQFLKEVVDTPITELDTEEHSDNAHLIHKKTVTVYNGRDGASSETTKLEGMNKLDAIKIDNLMQGDNEPESINHNVNNTGMRVMSPILFVRQNKKAREEAEKELKKKKKKIDNAS